MNTLCRLAGALLLALPPLAASAHDTWFELRAREADGSVQLALGTGDQFPALQFPLGIEQLRGSGCRSAGAAPVALDHAGDGEHALMLRAPLERAAAATCWAQTQPFELELTPALVALYLKEIQADATVHAAWAEMQRRGQSWTERYTKYARIDIDGRGERAAATGMGLDIVLIGAPAALRAGDLLQFQVLRDGAPLPGLAVELRSANNPLGLWRRTDADGRAQLPLPFAGRWLLRGTELRALPADAALRWDSRFVTLAFEVGERAALRTPAP